MVKQIVINKLTRAVGQITKRKLSPALHVLIISLDIDNWDYPPLCIFSGAIL